MTPATRGYVAVWAVSPDGTLASSEPITRYETPTSGGKANAVETFPFHPLGGVVAVDWIVLADDEQGWVWILNWDGLKLEEIAGVRLGEESGEIGVGASHAVWLS